jgi:transcriptional regulator with XRE-family HTH domain
MTNSTSTKHIQELGDQLERNRLLRNIPQTELAQMAGISTRTLRRFESGEGGSLDSFVRLLMALGIDGNLSTLIPDAAVRPMERARQSKTERLRASRSKKAKTNSAQKAPQRNHGSTSKSARSGKWVWGDEES